MLFIVRCVFMIFINAVSSMSMYSHESLCIIIFYYYDECKSDDVITDLLRACRGLDIIMRKCLYT